MPPLALSCFAARSIGSASPGTEAGPERMFMNPMTYGPLVLADDELDPEFPLAPQAVSPAASRAIPASTVPLRKRMVTPNVTSRYQRAAGPPPRRRGRSPGGG